MTELDCRSIFVFCVYLGPHIQHLLDKLEDQVPLMEAAARRSHEERDEGESLPSGIDPEVALRDGPTRSWVSERLVMPADVAKLDHAFLFPPAPGHPDIHVYGALPRVRGSLYPL